MVYSNLEALTASSKEASALSHTKSSPTLTSGLSAYLESHFQNQGPYKYLVLDL